MPSLNYHRSVENQEESLDVMVEQWGDKFIVMIALHDSSYRVLGAFKSLSDSIEMGVDVARMTVASIKSLPFVPLNY